MPFVDIIDRTHGISEPDEQGLRWIDNDTTDRHKRAVMAAQASHRAGGTILPEARGYNLPPLVTGYEIAVMGMDAWQDMLAAATWTDLFNADAVINLDHPDVKAVL